MKSIQSGLLALAARQDDVGEAIRAGIEDAKRAAAAPAKEMVEPAKKELTDEDVDAMSDEELEVIKEDQPHLLEKLMELLEVRDLRPSDFPYGTHTFDLQQQKQLVAKALERGRVENARRIAAGKGFKLSGGRLEWALQRWVKTAK